MKNLHKNITSIIGNTPIIRLDKLSLHYKTNTPILAKLEGFNPSGSVKDRTAFYMLSAALERKQVLPGGVVIESTAGNGGISLAMACAVLDLKLILIMPDDVPEQHIANVSIYGATVELFHSSGGASAAQQLMAQLLDRHKGAYLPKQFENEDAVKAHREGTAKEILDTLGAVDYFIAGVGTGATITGCGEALKMHCPDCRLIAVEPSTSPVISGGFAGTHTLTGIGPGFVPEILNSYILDEVIRVRSADCYGLTRDLARLEGLLCGISSGAALAAAVSVATRPEAKGKTVLTILPDMGNRYLDRLL